VDQAKPSRPRKAKRAPVKKVQPPLSADKKENKYAPKMKVGKPTIKAPGTKVVTTVGLGNLTVETVNGGSTNTNV